MKIKFVLIFIFSLILTQNFGNSNIEKKKESLSEIETQINDLETELSKQIQAQKNTNQELQELKKEILDIKNHLIENQNKEQYQAQLLKKITSVIDSLQNKSSITVNKKKRLDTLIKDIKNQKKWITKEILNLNDSLTNIKNTLNNNTDTLKTVKNKIKNILNETIFINAPNEIEFIIESNTWDNFILNTVIYNIIIENKTDIINTLLQKKEIIEVNYNQNLKSQSIMIQKKQELNKELQNYQKTTIRLNQDLSTIQNILKENQGLSKEIKQEYNQINNKVLYSQNILDSLAKEKNEIQKKQKSAADEKKRIEYALILKKDSREKVESEIKKLLLKSSQYKGSDITKLKNKLPWPIDGEILHKFGINTSVTGAKFDYTFIEIVGNKILYLVNQIDPKKPNRSLVKQFQKLTMNLNSNDTGYGVFGPQTTKKWKEYNKQINVEKKKTIRTIHEGKVEEIKFIDPITGVLIIIRHNDQTFSTYSGHIDLIVKKDDIVFGGQEIGFIKEKNILAFHLLVNSKVVNPEDWLIKK